jgi:hypothetical protein
MAFIVSALIFGALSGTLMAAAFGNRPASSDQVQVASIAEADSRSAQPPATVALEAQPAAAALADPSPITPPTTLSASVANATAPAPAVHKVLASYRVSAHHRRHRRRVHSLRNSHAPVRALAASVIVPMPEEAPPPRVLMIEGDVTVAGYDAAAGMIETLEGMNFVIDRAVGERNASLLADSPGSFHYRCDQQGSCTLAHAGLAFSAARTTT